MASVLSQFYRNILSVGSATPQEGTNGNDPLPVWVGGQHYHNGLDGNDTITNILPLAGNSYIEGGKGADTLTGGLLTEDTIGYLNSQFGVDVTLTAAGGITVNAWSGDAAGDLVVAGFENLVGSQSRDLLNGNDSANKILGMGGGDRISAGGGNDILYGGDGDDAIFGGAGNDYIYGENGADILHGGDGNDVIDGGPRDREFIFGENGNDVLYSLGDSYLDGGAGTDTVDYSRITDTLGTIVTLVDSNFEAGYGGAGAFGDRYFRIENVTGSNYNDDFYGNATSNKFIGNGGNDVFWARGGNDDMTGGAGSDRFYYDTFADINGDIIRDFDSTEGDKIDLTFLRGVFYGNIAEEVVGNHSVFSINLDGQSASITVFYKGMSFPGEQAIFDV